MSPKPDLPQRHLQLRQVSGAVSFDIWYSVEYRLWEWSAADKHDCNGDNINEILTLQ